MKITVLFSCLGVMFGLTQPTLSQVVPMDPMPWTAQLGVCGGCLTILFFAVVRVIPRVTERANETMTKISEMNQDAVKEAAEINAAALEGVRAEIRGGNDSQLALLRNVLHHKTEGGGS
jgi:hypothetical protein